MALTARGQLDPTQPIFVSCLGKKRGGKSALANLLFESYPYDRVIIDVNGDDGPIVPGALVIDGREGAVMPQDWPEQWRELDKPMTLRYIPNAASTTFLDDMDAAVGLAYDHGRTMLLVHEMGILAEANRTPPRTRQALHQGRHRDLSILMCAPRPLTMDTLVIAQSDLVYVFRLPNPNDRRRVAETIGWNPAEFDAAVHALGPHEYLRYDDNAPEPGDGEVQRKLLHFPALPKAIAKAKTSAQHSRR